jgi:hypothetical protein
MNQKIENWVLNGITALFCLYILLRAWLLPITVDESATAINHVPRLVFDTLTYQREANPNNHILNTILIKIFTGIFGWHHLVVRIPVLMGSFLYAWSAGHLARKLSDQSWVRIFALIMLFGNPYLLEFCSFARGYGLAVGLMTASLWYSWRFVETNDRKILRTAFLLAGLSVYANFTLLIFFAPFVCSMLLTTWQLNPSATVFWKQSKPAVTTLAVFLLLWITPLQRLSKDAEIVNWNALGTFFDAIQRSVRAAINANAYLGNTSDTFLTWVVFLGVFAMGLLAIRRWWKQGFKIVGDPRVLFVLLLLGAGLVNIVQVNLTKTPYLQARLALFYWPLFALSLGVSAAWLSERFGRKSSWILMSPLLLLCFINNVRTLNLHSSFEWFHDSDTFTVLEYLKKTAQAEGRTTPYSFDTEWFMRNSFLYHLEKGHYGYDQYVKLVPYHGRRDPQRDVDFFYAVNYDTIKDVLDVYDIVLRIPNSSLILLRKK